MTRMRDEMVGAPQGTRVGRSEARRRSRRARMIAGVSALALAAGTGAVWLVGSLGGKGAGASSGPSRLVVLAVRASPEPLVAVVGAGGRAAPAAIVVPDGMVVTIPGQGDGTMGQAATLPGPSLRVTVSNALGTWIDHYAVMDESGLARLIDDAGGAQIPAPQPPTGGPTGPPVVLNGRQGVGYLSIADPAERLRRWQLLLRGLLGGPVEASAGDFAEVDDPTAVSALLAGARGASVDSLPVIQVTDGLLRPDAAAIQRLVASAFGVPDRTPIPVIVLNGSGVPGVGELVAERLVPKGFRLVTSENAASFDHTVTSIVVASNADRPLADRVRALLGVGQITVSGLPSGLGDVTIVVGRDFTSG